METKTYIAKNNQKVELDINNNQKNDRPSKYILIDADFLSDVAISLNLKKATMTELLKNALRIGLDNLKIDGVALNIEDYNFSTSTMTPNIRNIGTHEQQKALYKAMMEETQTAKADTTAIKENELNKELLSYVAEQIKQNVSREDILKALLSVNSETIAKAHLNFFDIKAKVPTVPTVPTLPTTIKETF